MLGFHIIATIFWIAVDDFSDFSDPRNLMEYAQTIPAITKTMIAGIGTYSIPAIQERLC